MQSEKTMQFAILYDRCGDAEVMAVCADRETAERWAKTEGYTVVEIPQIPVGSLPQRRTYWWCTGMIYTDDMTMPAVKNRELTRGAFDFRDERIATVRAWKCIYLDRPCVEIDVDAPTETDAIRIFANRLERVIAGTWPPDDRPETEKREPLRIHELERTEPAGVQP